MPQARKTAAAKPAADKPPAKPKGQPVTRRAGGVWVCPQDHANAPSLDACGRCGAHLHGDRVECLEQA